MLDKFDDQENLELAIEENSSFYNKYASFLEVHTRDDAFNAYFNRNLPFQVLYQTFVSRSFCQTQKGYREIGFREIQDIYSSMYYFTAMGKSEFVKELLKEWCSKVFEFGYAYHNFFWVGKEAGKWSDDALWFIQAVYRYVNLTGDIGFMKEETSVAGTSPVMMRPIFKTIQAIIHYSAIVSVGKHGLPLLDNADWNDCLKIDGNSIDGILKERKYREQIASSGKKEAPFESDYSESVMNAFLLKVAIDEYAALAEKQGDADSAADMKTLSGKIQEKIQKYAWKEDFFARVLLNRYKNGEFEYIGAKGDKMALEPNLDGSYFINSYSWAILADSATESQIETMTDTLEKTLKTPFGMRLMTLTALNKVSNETASGHYFPGDRENGAVFKHASMMMTASMFKAAKEVKNKALAERLTNLAYWMIDLVLPYKTMENPYHLAGNPRICTQYINSETGENIGPLLSGTATWLNLSMLSAFGVEYTASGIEIDPILRTGETEVSYRLNPGKAVYKVVIRKPAGFCRISGGNYTLTLDGKKLEKNIIPLLFDGKEHSVELVFA